MRMSRAEGSRGPPRLLRPSGEHMALGPEPRPSPEPTPVVPAVNVTSYSILSGRRSASASFRVRQPPAFHLTITILPVQKLTRSYVVNTIICWFWS